MTNATAVAVAERPFAGPAVAAPLPLAVVFTFGEEGLGGLRGARHACRVLAPEAVLALEGHGSDRVEWRATDQALLDRQEAALAGLKVSPGLRLSVEHLDRPPSRRKS